MNNINKTIRHKMLMKHYIKDQKRWDNYDNYGRTNSQKVLKESLRTKIVSEKVSRKVREWRSYRV